MNKLIKSRWFLLTLILVIAAFLRFYQINKLPPGFYPDEAMYANNGVEAWETGQFKIFYPENNGREGLWPNIIGFFIVKFGHQPWVPRAVAAAFGLLTVLGTYFFAKELFSRKIALLSAFLIATSFWHINFSRIGFRAILAPFFLVWAIYFLIAALRQIKEQKSPKLYILNSVIAGIFYGLGFHTYIAYRATPLLILIILLFYWFQSKEWQIRKKILLSTFYFLLSTIIVAAPLLFYFIQNPQDFFGRTSQISIFSSPNPIGSLGINILKTAGMFNFQGDGNWRHNIAGRPELFWPVGVLFVIGIVIGVGALFKKSPTETASPENNSLSLQSKFWILFSWIIVASLPVVVSNESLPHALRSILMVPPVFILAGVGGICFYEIIQRIINPENSNITRDSAIKTKIFNISIFILLSLLIFQAYIAYFFLWGKNPNVAGAFSQNYIDIGRQLNALSAQAGLPQELPKYVIVQAGGVDVRGVPIPAQTVMFITDTFTPEKQKQKNIFYIPPGQVSQIPENSFQVILK